MKKIITILILFISAKCYSQNHFMEKNTFDGDTNVFVKRAGYTYNIHGTLSQFSFVTKKYVDSINALRLSLSDTANKWVNTITRTAGKDSIIFFIGSTRYAIKDSTGGGTNIYNTDGTLTGNRAVTQGTNTLSFTGTAGISSALVSINNNGGANGLAVTANGNGAGVSINYTGTTSPGLEAISTNSSGGVANFWVNPSSTNSSVHIASFRRSSSSTAANNIAGWVSLQVEADDGANYNAGGIHTRLVNADGPSNLVSEMAFTTLSKSTQDTAITFGNYVDLTESSATKFTSTTISTGKIQGGEVLVTVEANDGTDFQSRTLRFIWSAVNKAGTLTITLSTPEEVVALSSGTLTCTITAVDAGSGVLDFKANAVSSLTQTTLRCSFQKFKNF